MRVVLLLLAIAGEAVALPVGATVPGVVLQDTGKARVALPNGKNLLIFYEDKDAGTQNQRTRDLVGPITDRRENRSQLQFMAIADLAKWNWWPAKRYALKELSAIAKKEETTIYCDWTGEMRRHWNLTKGKSAVILVDAGGSVRFFGEGPLSVAQSDELLRQLAALGIK